MGFVYATATLDPTKQELAEAWLPSRSWAPDGSLEKVGEFRFDDPEGEVGVETIVWRTAGGALLQVPFTYRAAPLAGAEAHLVGTTDHSALGKRWVYDGCADPVWAETLSRAILTGGTQAQMVIERDGQMIDVPARIQVRGSGSPDADVPAVTTVDSVIDGGAITTVTAGGLTISVARVVGTPVSGSATLTGSTGAQDLGVLAALA
jgi:Maltokinase N-terminal cap domain